MFLQIEVFSFLYLLYIWLQIWNVSIEDQGIKEDTEAKQMVCYNANPVSRSHNQLWLIHYDIL